MELIPRSQTVSLFYGVSIFLSVALLFFANIWNQNVLRNGFVSFFKLYNVEDYVKKSYPLFNQSGILILISSVSTILLMFHVLHVNGTLHVDFLSEITVLTLSLSVFVLPLFILMVVAWLVSSTRSLSALFIYHVLSFYLFGLFCLAALLLWSLFNEDVEFLYQLILYSFGFVTLLRWVKSAMFVLKLYMPWYYIILYFCTLEFLPVLYLLYIID